ncbi:MAG: acyltransferase [Flavobacteriales bacterium]|nr:acyltransferase [Flavobacteriales bacterium]
MKDQIYLPGLNGIRAIAALLVLIFHIDIFIPAFQLTPLGYGKTGMAGYGVVLFFVLSGFLITFLLLHEKEKFGKINLPKFYMRRILRIWPIYYLVIFSTFILYFFFPNLIHFSGNKVSEAFLFYTFFVSNVGYGIGIGTLAIRPLWSVGVEEQFYAFWPFLVNKYKNILYALIGVIVIYTLVKAGSKLVDTKLYNIISLSRFDCMAMGGIGAYLYYTKSKVLTFIYHPVAQVISWSVLMISIAYKPLQVMAFIDKEIHAVFYLIIIMNVSTNKNTLIGLENKVLDFIGKISYGIYVYHMFTLVILSYLITKVFGYTPKDSISDYIMVYMLMLSCTFMLAYFSFRYFEKWFLKRKSKYAKIHSKSSANSSI